VPAPPAVSADNAGPVIDVRNHRRRDHHRHGFHVDRRGGWYNGHRGYRHHRPGYRHYNGYWFPPAAFALGVIIGQGAAREPGVRPGYTNPSHIAWCSDRYRSYRAYDNTFKPNNGPRRECRSPYY